MSVVGVSGSPETVNGDLPVAWRKAREPASCKSAVPAILTWGPSGERRGYARGGGPTRGVPPDTCSPGPMAEGPDPDFLCRRGYAVVNADPPGIGHSDGDARYSGREEGRDCADLIEWLAEQPWCDGKVGMAGNSYFAVVQLFAAAHQPPHLMAIAPWETHTDIYRQMECEGGIPEVPPHGPTGDSVSVLRTTLESTAVA
jgi:uncharacterized protein